MAASKQENKEEDFNYKAKYRAYKRRLKLLVYEQEYFKSILEKIEQSLLVVERDKSYVLDQLLQYENVSHSEDDSSDGLSDTELQPAPKGQVLNPEVQSSRGQRGFPLRDKKTPASKLKQLESASSAKKGARAAVEGAVKRGGVKRGTVSAKGAAPAKKVRKTVKPPARTAVKGLEVKTLSKTVQQGASKVELMDDNEDQLVISLPLPGPTPKTQLPGPIPNVPPTQFLDASSSSSSSTSGSDSSGSGNSSDSNDESGTEATAVKPELSSSVPSAAPLHMDEHAYGIPTKGGPPSNVSTSMGGARVVKLPEIKSEQTSAQHTVTAKPTPHRPSVLVSTIKGQSLGTIPSPLISPGAVAQRSPPSASGGFSFKWSNRPPERTGVETSPITGFVPLVGRTQDEKGKSPVVDGTGMAPKKTQVPLSSPLGSSAFHIVSPTSSPTKT